VSSLLAPGTALAALAVVFALVPAAGAGSGRAAGEPIEDGRQLYLTGCASCHGPAGEGTADPDGELRGPSLRRSGEAAAYYYLSTGRMPLDNSRDQPQRKRPAYTKEQIEALVAYVGSLGQGPELPRLDLAGADVAKGGMLYRGNCAPCHSAAGAGGALSYGRAAPQLRSAEPAQVAAAVRSGPGQMPVFGAEPLSTEDLADIIAYVRYLENPDDPGGVPLGRIGPIPEGLVAWLGMAALAGIVFWIGTRAPVRRRPG
jgi:ubiquinol-cytochrome c reductase cytochrome c subunit